MGGFTLWIYLSLVQYFCSLLAFLLSFTPTQDVEALFDWLASSCGSALQTGEVEQARWRIFFHLRFRVATIYAPHIRLHILLVQGRDMLVLIATLKNKIRFWAKITFNIQLGLEIVEHVLLFTPNLLANEVKVLPGGLRGGNEARLRQLVLFVLALLFISLLRIVHRCFNSIQQEFVLILLVSVHLIQVKFLYKNKKSKISTLYVPLKYRKICGSTKRAKTFKMWWIETLLTGIGFCNSLRSLFSLDFLGLLLLFLGNFAQFKQLDILFVLKSSLHLGFFLTHLLLILC